jgi:hypothetical protein
MKQTTKDMAKTALIADNNPQATSEELFERGLVTETTHAIWLTTEQLQLLEDILYRHAQVCTMVADEHMRKGRQAKMIEMDNKARNLEDLAYKIGYPLDKAYIERNAYK